MRFRAACGFLFDLISARGGAEGILSSKQQAKTEKGWLVEARDCFDRGAPAGVLEWFSDRNGKGREVGTRKNNGGSKIEKWDLLFPFPC